MSSKSIFLLLLATLVVFLIGFWLHIPYGGGYVYSDIVSVYQVRLEGFPPKAPYVEVFFEYPVIIATLAYASGLMASLFTKEHYTALTIYYTITSIILFLATFLTVLEVRKLCRKKDLCVLYNHAEYAFHEPP